MKKVLVLFTIFLSITLTAQNNPAYTLWDKQGNPINYQEALEILKKSQIILFGEIHNNTLCHWLQLEILEDLSSKGDLILGMEMFETDNQIVINEYFLGLIKERHFKAEAKFWDNYETDYKPLVEYAKSNEIPLIATNTPRRYASMVARNGGQTALTNLPDEAKSLFCDLPYVVDTLCPGYAEILQMGHSDNAMDFLEAQAIKDATMAQRILANWQKGKQFYHINGDFHSKDYGGIYWYLKKANKKLKVKTISTIETKNVEAFNPEWQNQADIIILIPQNMSKSY